MPSNSSYRPVSQPDPNITDVEDRMTKSGGARNDIKEVLEDKMSGEPRARRMNARFPWAGFGALILVVCLTGSASAILAVSKESPVQQWRIRGVTIQPQVWISVLSTVMDALVLFALFDGSTKFFWRQASQGTTLQRLHDYYESQAAWGALKRMCCGKFNGIAIACLLCLISSLRGPLFQRASIVEPSFQHNTTVELNLALAQLIPPAFYFGNGSIYSDEFQALLDQYTGHQPILSAPNQCKDTCTTSIKGFGFAINCSSTSVTPEVAREAFRSSTNAIGGDTPAFNVSAWLYDSGVYESDNTTADETPAAMASQLRAERAGRIDISSLYKTNLGCESDLTVSTCTLHQGIMNYSVVLHNGTIELQWPHWQADELVSITPPWNDFAVFTLGDFWGTTLQWITVFQELFNQEISVYPDGDGSAWAGIEMEARLARMFVNGGSATLTRLKCSTATFRDPTQYVLDQMRLLGFRSAVAAAEITNMKDLFGQASLIEPGLPLIRNWTQYVDATSTEILTVYTIAIPYLACAIVASLLGVAAVAPLYYGWWELGRDVSFNPLEVANAFDAPILRFVDNDIIASAVAKQAGSKWIRYGRIFDDADPGVNMDNM